MSPSYRLSMISLMSVVFLTASACSSPSSNQDAAEDQGRASSVDMSSRGDQGGTSRDLGAADQGEDMGDQGASSRDQGVLDQNTRDGGQDKCVDTPLYTDQDGDGQGSGASVKTECLKQGEQPSEAGLSLQAGDCDDEDPLQYVGASGVCNDRVDDDCDAMDEMCPTTQPSSTLLPNWDCTDDSPPDNVYAWAKFSQGNSHINPGCFVFFASGKDTFFVQRIGLDDTATCPRGGCICKYDNGNGYDQRLYAFTRRSDEPNCPDIQLGDEQNAVSNGCRKYLYHMFSDTRGYSYAATGIDSLRERLTRFDQVEIACVKDITFGGFPFDQLLTTDVTLNPGFVMPR